MIHSGRVRALLPLVTASLLVGYAESRAAAPLQAPGGAGAGGGGEHLAWDQAADSVDQIDQYSFMLYVDETPLSLGGAECRRANAGSGYTCSAALPAMPGGHHVLTMAAILNGVESGRSAPLTVRVAVAQTAARRLPAATPTGVPQSLCVDVNVCFVAAPVLSSTTPLSTPVVTPDDRLWFIEDGRHVRVMVNGAVLPEPALRAEDPTRLIALLVDPSFSHTHRITVAWVEAPAAGGRSLVVAAFRDVQGRLGEAAVLVQGLTLPPSGEPSVSQDDKGRIYVAMPSQPGPSATRELYGGQILRFTADGRVPWDTAQRSPVFAEGFARPSAIAYDQRNDVLWLAGRHDGGGSGLRKLLASPTVALASGGTMTRTDAPAWPLSALHVTSMARLAAGPEAVLLVDDNHRLFVATLGPDRRNMIASPIQHSLGTPVALAAGPHDQLYLTTMSGLGSPRAYVLYQLTPDAAGFTPRPRPVP